MDLAAIEQALDDGTYRAGPWRRFLEQAERLPRGEREALSEAVSRVSDRLHRRRGRPAIPLPAALAAEAALVGAGGLALQQALQRRSDLLALGAMTAWVTAFQPLVKVAAGSALGIRFSYAYLFGVEPRFKLRYGTYLAAPKAARVAFHLAGAVGSPLAAVLLARILRRPLPLAARVCDGVFWAVMGVNAAMFAAGVAGWKKVAGVPVGASSTGAAARELRGP